MEDFNGITADPELAGFIDGASDDEVNIGDNVEKVAADERQGASAEPKKVEFDEEQQAHVDTLVNERIFKERELENEAQRLREELAALRGADKQAARPEIPPLPDRWVDNYEELIFQRDEAIKAAVLYDSEKAASDAANESLSADVQKSEQAAMAAKVASYAGRATSMGITPEELRDRGQKVVSFGISDTVADFILSHENGPLITTYLAKNPAEIKAISAMSLMNAALYISNTVNGKITATKDRAKSPPEPFERVRSAGSSGSKSSGITFS